jgi:hypothetical protein
MNESSSELQRRDTIRRSFGNRDQFNTTATVFLLVELPSRRGAERFSMWNNGRFSRVAEMWLDGKG